MQMVAVQQYLNKQREDADCMCRRCCRYEDPAVSHGLKVHAWHSDMARNDRTRWQQGLWPYGGAGARCMEPEAGYMVEVICLRIIRTGIIALQSECGCCCTAGCKI